MPDEMHPAIRVVRVTTGSKLGPSILGAYRTVVDPDTGLSRVFIPAKVSDNPKLLEADPRYIDRLKSVGSPQRVRAWLEGDWTVVEGAFFSEWDPKRHVIAPFPRA